MKTDFNFRRLAARSGSYSQRGPGLMHWVPLALLGLVQCQDFSLVAQDTTMPAADWIYQPEFLGGLDFLIVVDKSGSMGDNNARLGEAMGELQQDIINTGVITDAQFVFITADSTHTEYVGPYTLDTPAIDMMLAPALLPASAGREEGFGASYVWYTNDMNSASPVLRQDAAILILHVTDEEEQSGLTADLYYQWLLTLKDDPTAQMDVVSVIRLETSTCDTSGTVGNKFIELAGYLNHNPIDICSADWGSWISESSFILSVQPEIKLSQTPVSEDTIVVYYDETPDPNSGNSPDNLTSDWIYTASSNTVSLGFEPAPGSIAIATYEVEATQAEAKSTSDTQSPQRTAAPLSREQLEQTIERQLIDGWQSTEAMRAND